MGRAQVKTGFLQILTGWYNAIASRLIRRSGAGKSIAAGRRRYNTAEIETISSAFQDLVSQIDLEGNELGQLYLEAERRGGGSALLNQTVMETVSSGIMVVERSGAVRMINSAGRDLLRLGQDIDVTGRRLSGLFLDGRDLEALMEEDMRRGKGSCRRVIQVMSLDARKRKLGVSTSCVRPDKDGEAQAVIAVFTVLDEGPAEGQTRTEPEGDNRGYLRGVLDSYDLMSGFLGAFGRIEEKSADGSLTRSELAEFSKCIRGTCDTMMAFALSLEASSSLTELVDVNAMIDSILRRRAIPPSSLAEVDLGPGLSRIKTVRKVLETGLELLIAGCAGASSEGISISTRRCDTNGSHQNDRPAPVEIRIRELGRTRPLLKVENSLRELIKGRDPRREAGMYLLASLPREGHLTSVQEVDGLFDFSVRLMTPIKKKAGKSQHKGDTIERKE
jgi:hypothetical protein